MTKRDRNYLIVFLAVILIFIGYLFIKKSGVKAYQIIQKHSYTQSSLNKGKYNGTFQAYNINFAEVNFTISNGKVRTFEIPTLIQAPWINAKPSIIDSITTKNSLEFDAISGATGTSLYVKAAIHEAIMNATKDSTGIK
jgi:uncharacterized protein with FMN-binding domain